LNLFNKAFGKPALKEKIKSWLVLGSASIEFIRITLAKLLGREGLVRQPSMHRMEYPEKESQVKELPGRNSESLRKVSRKIAVL